MILRIVIHVSLISSEVKQFSLVYGLFLFLILCSEPNYRIRRLLHTIHLELRWEGEKEGQGDGRERERETTGARVRGMGDVNQEPISIF